MSLTHSRLDESASTTSRSGLAEPCPMVLSDRSAEWLANGRALTGGPFQIDSWESVMRGRLHNGQHERVSSDEEGKGYGSNHQD
ncbi:hypothetical protein E4U54_002497 [Claviceps lovelessii]|nr:hypothetical protein E4U54_002497 [Claviceps lovelessii]